MQTKYSCNKHYFNIRTVEGKEGDEMVTSWGKAVKKQKRCVTFKRSFLSLWKQAHL